MFKVNSRSTRRCSSVFFAGFEHVNAGLNTLFIYVFRVGPRRFDTFKTKLFVTTVNSSFQLLPISISHHKELQS